MPWDKNKRPHFANKISFETVIHNVISSKNSIKLFGNIK